MNNFAISSAQIGSGIKEAASAMAIAGNSLDETIAQITAITEITQDSQSAANALRTYSMRLRGMKTELEAAGEDTTDLITSTSKLQAKIKALSGVNIMIDDNSFKSTFQITKELSKAFSTMNDSSKAALLEVIAGKTRANQISALLSNESQMEKALETSLNSAGSAAKENATYIDSIQGRINQLKATYEDLSSDILDSELIKNGAELLTGILKFVDNLTASSESSNLGENLKESIFDPTIDNLTLIGDLLKGIPTGIESIFKALKLLPPILGVISASATIKKKDLGKQNCPLLQRKQCSKCTN